MAPARGRVKELQASKGIVYQLVERTGPTESEAP